MTNDERFYEVLERHSGGIEPLQNWTTDDLLDLQQVLEDELAARDRLAQEQYFAEVEATDDEDDTWYEDDIMKCGDPDCGICYE